MKGLIKNIWLFLTLFGSMSLFGQIVLSKPSYSNGVYSDDNSITIKPGRYRNSIVTEYSDQVIIAPTGTNVFVAKISDKGWVNYLNQLSKDELLALTTAEAANSNKDVARILEINFLFSSIDKVSNAISPSQVAVSTLCLNFDSAGNQIGYSTCATTQASRTSDMIPEQTQPEAIVAQTNNQFFVYPNPTQSRVNVRWDDPNISVISAQIVSMNTAYKQDLLFEKQNQNIEADLSSQPSGLYIIIIQLSTGETIKKTIIKL
ncbi:MAG: hypothetical protein C4K58_04370 [Flavobacteriaceae bacterium]|nr:MAG: hypothetical protein C4K58_04370 [Flavobacteriaceae bacterium]